ncbi:hypothetical protein [Microbacterium halophytorum]|uniref:hypothetical protein n=1 Tax=Microbacterium halophytorum TaxID=2067568 RepID=UPI001571C806|nr:hypothetical protein [Microbacterium halophytorum]
MGRSRSRRAVDRRRREEQSRDGFDRMLSGFRRTETRRGREYSVQPVSGQRAVKEYTCPGCSGTVAVGAAHVVVWREDGVMGPEADLAARRHWHTHCWSIA